MDINIIKDYLDSMDILNLCLVCKDFAKNLVSYINQTYKFIDTDYKHYVPQIIKKYFNNLNYSNTTVKKLILVVEPTDFNFLVLITILNLNSFSIKYIYNYNYAAAQSNFRFKISNPEKLKKLSIKPSALHAVDFDLSNFINLYTLVTVPNKSLYNLPLSLKKLKCQLLLENTVLPEKLYLLCARTINYGNYLPVNLKKFKFTFMFQKELDYLPVNLNKLHFNGNWNSELNYLPINLKILCIGIYFNQALDHLPSGLQTLKIYGAFNQVLDHLPVGLQTLRVHGTFNQTLDYLSSDLQTFKLCGAFNQALNYLSADLQKLMVCGNFNQVLDYLPKLNILLLQFHTSYKRSLGYLPETLKILRINFAMDYLTNLNYLPNNLVYLNLCTRKNINFYHLSNSLEFMYINCNIPLNTASIINFQCIPKKLTTVSICPNIKIIAQNLKVEHHVCKYLIF